MLSRYSVKRPYTVVVGVVLILLLGYVSFTSMQTDLLPDMTLPYAIVYTMYPGASPEEVETVVTRPVEQAMATISNIETVNSVSSENISMVILEFSQSANMDAVTVEMRESLDQIGGYWDDTIGSPIIMKLNPDMLPVMVAAMEGGDLTQSELTALVDNEILPELESIEGVASVSATGTIEEQVQVLLREDKIKAVNKKITAALDDKFEEAEEELNEAQSELDEGMDQLEEGQKELIDKTSSAQGQLSTGQAQLITGQAQIDEKLAEVEAGLTQLDASEKELKSKEKELKEGEEALQQLPAQREALVAQQAQLESVIAQLEAAPLQLAQLEAAIAADQAEISSLKSQIEALQAIAGAGQTGSPSQDGTGTQTEAPAQGGAEVQTEASAQNEARTQTDASAQAQDVAAMNTNGAALIVNGELRTQSAGDKDQASLTVSEEVRTRSAEDGPDMAPADSEGALAAADGAAEAGADAGMAAYAESGAVSDAGDAMAAPAESDVILDSAVEASSEGAPGADASAGDSLTILSQSEIEEMVDQITQGVQDAQPAAQLAELQSRFAAKEQELASLQTAKQQALSGLSVLGVDTTGDYASMVSSIDTVKSGFVSRKLQLDDGIATMDETIENMTEQLQTLAQGKEAIVQGKEQIKSGRKQLQGAKQQLLAAKAQIASGQSSIPEAVAALNSAQISATIEMAAGKAQLTSGQKELDAALEQVKAQKDAAYDQADVTQIITADMVKGLLAAQNFSMPAGYVTEDGTDFLVRIGNKFDSTEGLEELVLLDLHMDGVDPIKLSDVADVTVLDDSDTIYAKVNGHEGVMFTMQKQSGYSTGDVSNKIKEKFAQLEAKEDNIHIIRLMDQGIYIDMVVNSVIENMLSGAVLAILVLLLFLKDIRPTFVIACSIPISIMAAIVLMYFSGITLNIISLSGLALGIGMLVDNSIVVIENIYRLRGLGYTAKRAAVEGAGQMAGAIAASTLTTICVFLPIVFTEGITRQLFVDMGLTIAYSLLASLVVALTLVPMMGAGLLKNVKEKRSRFFDWICRGYGAMLRVTLKVKFLVLLLAVGLLGLSGYLAVSKGTAFMPEMESTQISVTVQAPKGSMLAETGALSDQVIDRILTIQDVTDVGAMNGSGSAMSSLTGGGGQSANEQVSMYVLLDEDKTITNEELAKQIMEKTSDLDCEVIVNTSTMDMSALGGSGISVQIKGRDLDQLKSMAGEVAELVKGVEGTKNVSDGIEEKTLELRLVVDKEKAISYQLTTAQVFQFLQQKLADATSATTLSTLSQDYPVMVVSDTDEALTREKIKKLKITGKNEENQDVEVPLSRLVEFQNTEGFSSINRESQTRYVTVTAELEDGSNIGLVASDVKAALAEYEVPEGYSIEMTGEDETINEAMGQVVKMLALAVVFMYLIMVAQFQSLLSPFIVMFTIPLAFTGGLFALYLTDSPVSVIAMIGFVMLSGIIVNNGIVLVDYINQLRREGMEKRDAIVEAGRTRLRPIIMTALTTILGLLTMALGVGMGADMVQPMAIVTIGGLTYGTLLTLFVVPCIYDIFNRKKSLVEEEI